MKGHVNPGSIRSEYADSAKSTNWKNKQQQNQSNFEKQDSDSGIDWYAMTLANDYNESQIVNFDHKLPNLGPNEEILYVNTGNRYSDPFKYSTENMTRQASYQNSQDQSRSSNRQSYQPKVYNRDYESNLQIVEQGIQNMDMNYSYQQQYQSRDYSSVTSKRNTWARIASQPAKMLNNCHSSGSKKKGPGMPPGPIIPRKYNIDVEGAWDNNKPPMPLVEPLSAPILCNGPVPKPTLNIRSSSNSNTSTCMPSTANAQNLYNCNTQNASMVDQMRYPTEKKVYQQSTFCSPESDFGHHYRPQLPSPVTQQSEHLPNSNLPSSTSCNNTNNNEIATHPILEELQVKNNYNPKQFDLMPLNARFFVIKSYSEDDIHRSIKYEIWCSTERGNKRLDRAYNEQQNHGPIYLFFSVNASGHFCGVAQMVSNVDYNCNSSVWAQDKWKGQFRVSWIYVKDVPNTYLRNVILENNENKPVTNSRDTQEVPYVKGCQVLRIIHNFTHTTSIFDDFIHYEKQQEEGGHKKTPPGPVNNMAIRPRPMQYNNNNNDDNQERHHSQNFTGNKMPNSFKSREYYRSGGGGGDKPNFRNYDRDQSSQFF